MHTHTHTHTHSILILQDHPSPTLIRTLYIQLGGPHWIYIQLRGPVGNTLVLFVPEGIGKLINYIKKLYIKVKKQFNHKMTLYLIFKDLRCSSLYSYFKN